MTTKSSSSVGRLSAARGAVRRYSPFLCAALLLGALASACGDTGSDDGQNCTPGTDGCECLDGTSCFPGLSCIAGFCIADNAEMGDAETGDGNGDGDGDGDQGCDPGLVDCGKCVDIQEHPLHCGGCDMPCDAGDVCVEGSCTTIEDCTMEPCPGFSYCDLRTQQCLPGCSTDEQCNSGEYCDPGTHACVPEDTGDGDGDGDTGDGDGDTGDGDGDGDTGDGDGDGDGAYGPCPSGDDADCLPGEICVTGTSENVSYSLCTIACVNPDDCDVNFLDGCADIPGDGIFQPYCSPVLPCSFGSPCPDGMDCLTGFQGMDNVCVWPL